MSKYKKDIIKLNEYLSNINIEMINIISIMKTLEINLKFDVYNKNKPNVKINKIIKKIFLTILTNYKKFKYYYEILKNKILFEVKNHFSLSNKFNFTFMRNLIYVKNEIDLRLARALRCNIQRFNN